MSQLRVDLLSSSSAIINDHHVPPLALRLWFSGPVALWLSASGPPLWLSGRLALWPSSPLALWLSGSGPRALWLFGSGLLALGLLGSMYSPPAPWLSGFLTP